MQTAIDPGTITEKRVRPSRRRRWSIYALLGIAAIGYTALRDWRDSHAFLINSSESLPNWAFLIHYKTLPARGDYVFFQVPRTPLITKHFGDQPKPFGKLVYGMPGDMVSRTGATVSVNGRAVAHLKPFSKRGEPLAPGPIGRIPDSCYFVGTPHPDGFDSRYADVGFVCRRAVIGTGVAIL